MGIEKILNKNKIITAATVASLGLAAGCVKPDDNYKTTPQNQIEGVPISDVGAYGTENEIQLPTYNLDGKSGKRYKPLPVSEQVNWLSDNQNKIRSSARCNYGFGLVEDQNVIFTDGSYCTIDLCMKKTPTVHSGGGDGPTGGGEEDGPTGGGEGRGAHGASADGADGVN